MQCDEVVRWSIEISIKNLDSNLALIFNIL